MSKWRCVPPRVVTRSEKNEDWVLPGVPDGGPYSAMFHVLFTYQNRLSCEELAVDVNAAVPADHEPGSSAASNPTVFAFGVTLAAGMLYRPSVARSSTSVWLVV